MSPTLRGVFGATMIMVAGSALREDVDGWLALPSAVLCLLLGAFEIWRGLRDERGGRS